MPFLIGLVVIGIALAMHEQKRGGSPVAPNPNGGGGVVPVKNAQAFRLLSISEVLSRFADAQGFFDDTPSVSGLAPNMPIILLTTDGGGFYASPATVVSNSGSSATVEIAQPVAGGPPILSNFDITSDNAAYFDATTPGVQDYIVGRFNLAPAPGTSL